MKTKLDRLDAFALKHKGPWTTFERRLYECAVRLLRRNT